MIEAIPAVRKMAPYALADLQPDLLSLAQNESAYPCSPKALQAADDAARNAHVYCDSDWTELRRAIAAIHKLDADNVLCGAGSMDLISSIIRAYSQPGDEVLGTQYGYLFVATACQLAGSHYRQSAETDYRVSVDSLLSDVTTRTKIVFVCNPGNPTGTRIDNSELIRLRESLPSKVLLVIDQAYAEFDNQSHDSLFHLVNKGQTIITRTFSKAYALAGERVGWGAFPTAVAVEVRKLLNPNNVSTIAQAMATAAMLDQDYMQQCVSKTAAIREQFRQTLLDADLAVPESHTNFVLIPLADKSKAQQMDDALKAAGFLARGMGGYSLPNCLRITMESAENMAHVANVITQQRQS